MSAAKYDERSYPRDDRWRGRQPQSELEQLEREFYELLSGEQSIDQESASSRRNTYPKNKGA